MHGADYMNRAFVSLYLIIVLSIVLLGLVLNKFWDEMNPSIEVDPAVVDLIALIETTLKTSQNTEKDIQLKLATKGLKFQAKLVSIENFSTTNIAEKIKQGGVINVNDVNTHYFYKRIESSDDVLVLAYPSTPSNRNSTYLPFILVFYTAIAAAVFLWVWPLARDLARLAQHAQQLGKDGQQDHIKVSSRSVVYPFANAFYAMSARLSDILRSQKEMTLAVSHELRTPLARMKFALAITEEQHITDELRSPLAGINRDILEMESLINSFLAYAAFDQQSQRLNQREGYIQDLLQNIISRLLSQQDRNIHIKVEDETQGQGITCEWSLMQTALQNVIHNALGYAKSLIVIAIKITPSHFIVSVADDGPGVSEDQQERIFESFVRIYNEQNHRSGFGLGLALVKRIMDWHRGSVVCTHSGLGGAQFTLQWLRQT
jgi:two-component system, OmpR family, sensor kinase